MGRGSVCGAGQLPVVPVFRARGGEMQLRCADLDKMIHTLQDQYARETDQFLADKFFMAIKYLQGLRFYIYVRDIKEEGQAQ
jgi:hypothetical protein